MKREISIKEIKGIRIGQAENTEAGTGCTVFLSEEGMAAGLDVRGGGPASRESELMDPLAAAQVIHGIVLAGGSAFGLNAADGVMEYLRERKIGFEVGPSLKVPLVCSLIFLISLWGTLMYGRIRLWDMKPASIRKEEETTEMGTTALAAEPQ